MNCLKHIPKSLISYNSTKVYDEEMNHLLTIIKAIGDSLGGSKSIDKFSCYAIDRILYNHYDIINHDKVFRLLRSQIFTKEQIRG